MDNAYFIGYRIDVDCDIDSWDFGRQIEKFGVDNFPNSEWYNFRSVRGVNSLLWMKEKSADYRCPIDRQELWEDLHHRTFDFPADGVRVFQEICKSPLYSYLLEKYGDSAVNVKWGIFLCLS